VLSFLFLGMTTQPSARKHAAGLKHALIFLFVCPAALAFVYWSLGPFIALEPGWGWHVGVHHRPVDVQLTRLQ
jgi:hypothetical protein